MWHTALLGRRHVVKTEVKDDDDDDDPLKALFQDDEDTEAQRTAKAAHAATPKNSSLAQLVNECRRGGASPPLLEGASDDDEWGWFVSETTLPQYEQFRRHDIVSDSDME